MDRKNKKGEASDFGKIIILFVGIIFCLAILPAIFDSQATMTETRTVYNVTYTAPTAVGDIIDLEGQEYIGSMIVTNASTGGVVPASNYTIGEGISASTGKKTVTYTAKAGGNVSLYPTLNMSYEYGADGYNTEGGARSIGGLIGLFSALALLAFAVVGIKGEWF